MRSPNARPDLRERLRGGGTDALTEIELLALVLGSGRPGRPVTEEAARILLAVGGLAALLELETSELEQLPGLGPARAARLSAALELGRRLWRPRLRIGEPVESPRDAARYFDGLLRGRPREEFHALLLDSRHNMLGHRLVSIGSLQSSVVHPREVFRNAVRIGAAAVVVAHNHPSGHPAPSPEDRAVTQRLQSAGALLGIELVDHLVVGESSYYSFAEDEVLPMDWVDALFESMGRGGGNIPDAAPNPIQEVVGRSCNRARQPVPRRGSGSADDASDPAASRHPGC